MKHTSQHSKHTVVQATGCMDLNAVKPIHSTMFANKSLRTYSTSCSVASGKEQNASSTMCLRCVEAML
eukprot:9032455-Prorocentrum_lima.AAC.1